MKRIILLSLSLFTFALAQSQIVNITVTVNNVKSSKGIVKVCLFNKETGFPEKSNLSFKCTSSNAAKGIMKININGIPSGKYAIAVHHDENNDGEFNTNFFGIPTEASGASNGAKGKMGPPKYSDAVITIDKDKTQISVTIEY